MKIVHFIFSLQTGGSETMLIDLVNEQVKSSQVYLLILNNQINKDLISTINKTVKLYLINRPEGSRNPFFIAKLNFILWKLNPDVVHCHSYNAIRLLKLTRLNIVYTAHTTGIPVNSLLNYKKIFAISQAVKRDLLKRGATFDIAVVHNGINCKLIKPKENNSGSIFRIIQIGRLDHQVKGQHILLKAIQILIHEKNISNIKVDFIGQGSLYDYLKKLTIEYKIIDNVNFLGLKSRDYIYTHLQEYNLLVQPSLIEGFGLTIAEAMAAKVPVLVSNIDGPMEIIGNGKYGSFFVTENAEDCAGEIFKIMTNYKQIQDQTVLAYNHCIQNFSMQVTARFYVNCY